MIKYCGECGADLRDTNGICYNCASKHKYSSGGVINISNIKEGAKEVLDKHFGKIFISSLFVYALLLISSVLIDLALDSRTILYDVASIIRTFVFMPLAVGLLGYILNIIRDKEVGFDDIFKFYDKKIFLVFSVSFLVSLFSLLWGLLLIVPGIIVYISYSLSFYVLVDNEEKSVMEILNESKRLTDGYKGDIFVFYLSFIGWILISVITFGIALIYVIPYIEVSTAMYYDTLKDIKKIE